jgi:hypothetical protein
LLSYQLQCSVDIVYYIKASGSVSIGFPDRFPHLNIFPDRIAYILPDNDKPGRDLCSVFMGAYTSRNSSEKALVS